MAGRPVEDVTLIAVAKTYPASDVVELAGLGVRDIGENRDQEAAPKAIRVAAAGANVTWHFIGQLQRNKCRSVARYASVVHSVDRLPLVRALATARQGVRDELGVPPLDVLVQVNLDDPLSHDGDGDGQPARRGGMAPGGVLALADAIAAEPSLRLAGVMAVAPATQPTGGSVAAVDADPDRAFATLSAVADALRQMYPEATTISAGMSADLEFAITHGATHVRVGSSVLGKRPSLG